MRTWAPRFLVAALLVQVLVASSARAATTETPDISTLLDQMVVPLQAPDGDALMELEHIGRPVIKPALQRLKNETDPRKQRYYLILLYALADGSMTDAILPYAKAPQTEVRSWAISILARAGNQDAIPALVACLNDTALDPQIRQLASDRLQYLTGQTIDYRASMTDQERYQAYQQWEAWWQARQKKARH